jgi:hypothetical protein
MSSYAAALQPPQIVTDSLEELRAILSADNDRTISIDIWARYYGIDANVARHMAYSGAIPYILAAGSNILPGRKHGYARVSKAGWWYAESGGTYAKAREGRG